VTWAARRYMRHLDRDGYERLVARYGEPDHPMVHYARGFVSLDSAVMAEWGPRALAALCDAGDDRGADLFAIAGLGTALILSGRLADHDALLAPRVARHRTEGPPTCLNWGLTQLATSASLQGRHHDAWALFDEAAQVAVPPRTHSLRNPLDARAALRRGDRAGAFRLLRAYVADLIDQENLYLARLGCVEFVNLMAAAGRPDDAARILDHLAATGAFDETLPYRALTASAAARVAAEAAGRAPAPVPDLDDRGALVFMRDALDPATC